jgi:hypothetical protein
MGISTDAILYFGLEAGDEDNLPPALEASLQDDDIELDEWLEARMKDEPLLELSTHCCGEFPMYYVCVKRLHYTADRGNPEDIPFSLGLPTEDEVAALGRVRKALGIPEYELNKWRLASYASNLR